LLFFLQADAGIRSRNVTAVHTCALPTLLSEEGKKYSQDKYINRLSHEMCDLAKLQAMENRLLRMIQNQEVQKYTLNWRRKRLIMTRRLGKGLDALISDRNVEEDTI